MDRLAPEDRETVYVTIVRFGCWDEDTTPADVAAELGPLDQWVTYHEQRDAAIQAVERERAETGRTPMMAPIVYFDPNPQAEREARARQNATEPDTSEGGCGNGAD